MVRAQFKSRSKVNLTNHHSKPFQKNPSRVTLYFQKSEASYVIQFIHACALFYKQIITISLESLKCILRDQPR